MSDKSNISILEKARCTGCGACDNVCPVGAITMRENGEGFLYPEIDKQKCVNCGLCAKRCPVLNPAYPNKKNPECRAIWAKDEIRMKAASGGIFTAFAEILLKRGGVICGAAYNDDLTASLIVAQDHAGLEKIRSSKYMQASAGHAYKEIEKLLSEGKEVLFGGCPCQVAALYACLGDKRYDNLYTMDLICHGVPSAKVFRRYAEDTYGKGNVESVDFRAKEKFGWSTEITVKLKSGSVIRKKHDNDSFYRAFLPCMALRKSCATCEFSRLPRQGDLTIGDFWGISRYKKELNDKKGTSVVLVNNAKGRAILKECEELWAVNEKVPIEQALVVNKTIEHPFKPHPARRRFFENLDKTNFTKLVDDCSTHHYDVGIAGLWYGLNYGSILTYFALNRVISDMGYQCLMLNKPSGMWTDRYIDRNTLANRFIYKTCYVANINPDREDLFRLNNHCDTFVVGSDVVWNYNICGREAGHYFYLDFVVPSKKKIAYASSFGDFAHGNEEYETLSRYYLKQFDAISVREKAAVDYLSEKFNVEAEQVLDPVFLCDIGHYRQAIADSRIKESGDFFATYFLGPGQEKKNAILALQNSLGIEFRNLSNPNRPTDELEQRLGLPLLRDVSVEDWLYYMSNCKFYIGDSFHGLCFAIIFHRPFIVFIDKNLPSRGRFDTLLKITGLEDRMIYLDSSAEELSRLAQTPIDYGKVEERLRPYRENSYQWLKAALDKKKAGSNLPVSQERINSGEIYYDMLMARLADREKEIDRLSAIVQRLCEGKNMLQFAQNFDDYLAALNESKNRSIYIVAVKDTPGLSVTEEAAQRLKNSLGIRQDMVQKHWKSYLAVVDGGKVVFEEISDGRIDKTLKLGKYDLQLSSAALNVGNVAKIEVNGIEYALNRRGFNIVAIDKVEGRVCDSACLDLHLRQYAYYHKVI